MGRIKGTLIKNVGKKMLLRKELFSSEFQKNKEELKRLGFQATKAELNKVAGFITRKLRLEKAHAEEEVPQATPQAQAQQPLVQQGTA